MPRKAAKSYTRKPTTHRRRVYTKRRPPVRRIYGHGKYSTKNKFGQELGQMIGTAAMPFLGAEVGPLASLAPSIGGWLGGQAQGLMSNIMGHGDYRTTVNTLIHPETVPEFQSSHNRCTRIKHREYISDIVASNNSPSLFSNISSAINPGNSNMFPWLSQIAANFEQYRFEGLIYEYKPTSGVASTTPALGTIIMATQYNTLSPVFTNKQQMENYEFSGSTVPSMGLIHPIECDPKQTQCNGIFNVSTNDNLEGGDARLYNLGTFNIASVGLPTALEVAGELWVSYDCCLMKPRLDAAGGNRSDHWVGVGTGFDGATNWFGTDIHLTASSDDFTVIATTAASATITFNTSFYGNVIVTYIINQNGAVAAPQAPVVTPSNGASGLNLFVGAGTYAVRPVGGSAAIKVAGVYCCSIQPLGNGTLPTLTFSSGSFSTVANVDVLITQIPTNFA